MILKTYNGVKRVKTIAKIIIMGDRVSLILVIIQVMLILRSPEIYLLLEMRVKVCRKRD